MTTTPDTGSAAPDPDTAEPGTAPDTQPDGQLGGTEDDHADQPATREAAKWRTRFREAEQRVTNAETVIQNLQTQAAERMLNDRVTPAALWATTTLDTLIDTNTGTVDPEKLDAAIETAREQFGIRPTPTWGTHSGATPQHTGIPRWTDAFTPPHGTR